MTSLDTAFDAPTYEPKPGSVAQRAIAHLETLAPGAALSTGALAEAIGVAPALIGGSLESPLKAGVLLAHQRGGHSKSPRFWALAMRTNGMAAGPAPAADGSVVAKPRAAGHDVEALSAPERPRARRSVSESKPAAPLTRPAAASSSEMRIALWSDGVLQIERPAVGGAAELVLLAPDETRALVRYLDRMAIREDDGA